MWSQKLCQLGRIMAEYPQFWCDRLVLDRVGITTTFTVANEDLNKIAEFREAVQNDTSFWYHFREFQNASGFAVTKKYKVPTGNGPSVTAATAITFATKMPLAR
jgi:hypothetical protein